MKQGYFTSKEGYPIRPNFGTTNNIVSISEMAHSIPLRSVHVVCNYDMINEMELKGYKFNSIKILDEANEQSDFDYMDLLRKYIKHITECEGIDFLDHIGHVNFTDEETKELSRLSELE